MVFILLNCVLLLCFLFLTFYVDKRGNTLGTPGTTLLVPLLFLCVELGLYILVMIFKDKWLESLTVNFVRIIFCLDGIFFVSFSYGLVGLTTRINKFFPRLLEWLLYGFVIYIVFFQFKDISVDQDLCMYVGSERLFTGDVNKYFPWDWVFLFNNIYKFILPGTAFLFLMVLQERRGNQLQKYQCLVIAEGIAVMWGLTYFFRYLGTVRPAFASLYMYAYLAMYVLVIGGLGKTSVPSAKAFIATIFRNAISYVLPAAGIGCAVMFLQPEGNYFTFSFISVFVIISIVAVLFALLISEVMSNDSRLYTADYGPALEKQLAKIDYAGEMDEITNRMYEIFRRHVEASSVNVYILNNKNVLETAYTSNGFTTTIPVNTTMFETLLNINRSVVCWSQIGNVHDLSTIEEQLTKFFDETKSDAMFILNEGHNILGLITLGKKVSGDHYKDYDYNIFLKLYSYFFVFGYYMRNISNKEIISVVNREIKMSSQIITSIQENIDHVKNPKIDTGYLMVPARNIGGEFIDMIRLTDTRHLFVVGDMSGKGIAASMNMVILKSIIRTYLAETHDFKELVIKINSFIRDSLNKGTIFAGLFALIDFETDTMYYINCGIPALMLYTQVYNNVIEIQGSGHILGFVKDIAPYITVKTTKLSRGDIILACTDGLVQSHSLRGEQFGKERIQQCLLDNSTYPAQRMTQFTFDNLMKFMSKEMEDDVSILVLKYETGRQFNEDEPVEEEVEETVEETTTESTEDTATDNLASEEPVGDTEALDGQAEEASVEDSAVAESDSAVVEPVETTSTESAPAAPEDDFFINDNVLPDDPDIPDLSNLDEMIKNAGL
ncbi:MAG: serine/threonine-protein phosphatase [Treponema sp.]|nr:serine/threonine-protein phosphatase [Treponema sp.]